MSHQPHDQNRKDLDDLAGRRSAYSRPRSRKMQPNDRVQRSAATLLDLGVPVTVAVGRLFEQLDAIGYPSTSRQGPQTLQVFDIANPDLDTTGDGALRASDALALKEDLRDAITDIEKQIDALARLVVKITNEPLPGLDGVALCSDGQHGREGQQRYQCKYIECGAAARAEQAIDGIDAHVASMHDDGRE